MGLSLTRRLNEVKKKALSKKRGRRGRGGETKKPVAVVTMTERDATDCLSATKADILNNQVTSAAKKLITIDYATWNQNDTPDVERAKENVR